MQTVTESLLAFNDLRPIEREMFEGAVIVRAQNVAEYLYHGSPQEYWDVDDFPNLAPPWPRFVVEFSMPDRVSSDVAGEHRLPLPKHTVRLAALWNAKEHTDWEADPLMPRWRIGVAIYALYAASPTLPQAYEERATFTFDVDRDGRFHKDEEGKGYWGVTAPMRGKVLGEDMVRLMEFSKTFVHVSMLTVSFCHCRNVRQEIVKPGEHPGGRRSRSASKMGGRADREYRLIHIEPMKAVLRSEGNLGTTGLKQALHICRGHFRHYTEAGTGLFGKGIYGDFWTPQTVRGSAGAVAKTEYTIDPNQEAKSDG